MAIVVLVLAGVLVLVFLGGLVAARARDRRQAPSYSRHVAEADHALEQARASDKGWDREVMEQAARRALEEARPGFDVQRLELVLVDDRPGTDQDRAHFVAVGGSGEVRVVLARTGDHWGAERVE